MKKIVKVALLIAILAAGGVGYVISQVLLERTVTGTVSVASQPDLYVLGADGKAISTLDFGQLVNGNRCSTQCKIYNAGNEPLSITMTRTDTTQINSIFKNANGSPYDNSSPVTLNIGEALTISIEIWNTVNLAPGTYQLEFKFSGS